MNSEEVEPTRIYSLPPYIYIHIYLRFFLAHRKKKGKGARNKLTDTEIVAGAFKDNTCREKIV